MLVDSAESDVAVAIVIAGGAVLLILLLLGCFLREYRSRTRAKISRDVNEGGFDTEALEQGTTGSAKALVIEPWPDELLSQKTVRV